MPKEEKKVTYPMNETEKQILVNQVAIIGALSTLMTTKERIEPLKKSFDLTVDLLKRAGWYTE